MKKGKKAAPKSVKGFSAEERAAMKERYQELQSDGGEAAVLAKIAQMPEPDRAMAKRIHAIVKANASTLSPKTWYGMPAYANADGKVVCFFQSGHKYKVRYCSFGFSDSANLDEDNLWPTYFAISKLTAAEEAKLIKLIKKAIS